MMMINFIYIVPLKTEAEVWGEVRTRRQNRKCKKDKRLRELKTGVEAIKQAKKRKRKIQAK